MISECVFEFRNHHSAFLIPIVELRRFPARGGCALGAELLTAIVELIGISAEGGCAFGAEPNLWS